MRSPLARGAIALGALAAVVVLFIVLAGGDDDGGSKTTTGTTTQGAGGAEAPKPAVPRIVVVNGKPRGGVKKLSFKKGDRIEFVVQSDVADEIHVHGFDIKKDVPAGGTVRFDFPASIEGVFEAELEGRREQIAELRVTPG